MPALQKAKPATLAPNGLSYVSVSLPKQQRTTRVVKEHVPPTRSPPNSSSGSEPNNGNHPRTHPRRRNRLRTHQSLSRSRHRRPATRLPPHAPLAIGIVAADATNLSKGLPCAKVLAVSGEAFAQPRYATDAAACEALCRAAAATIVLAPSSSRFARVAARRSPSPRRPHRHPHHMPSAAQTDHRSHPLVLSPAHRSRPHPRRPPLVPAPRRRHARTLRRRVEPSPH